ncbi:hypothetical protein FHX08_004753 [Rhizobium sp. BK529]|uniref:hypothetical protein n=1 Tax=Rhizobium sp. BK529 TaxID=2586983 RepID=UPI00160A7BB6|nr:hypothetical protein [Rhizobium sp. BK529]MBB3594349.1 hypothetical protein [Rhizobium sp. BK529]
MTSEACRLAFAQNDDRVKAVNSCIPEPCGCEAYTASDMSPGTVASEETLHFLVYTPEGRMENGYLNPALVMQSQTNGLSVLRGAASDSEFEVTAEELLPRWQTRGRSLDGVMIFPASAVRYKDEVRFCGVYDTAMERKPHHADIMMVGFEGLSNSQAKKRLKSLVDAIGTNFEDMDTFRDGRLGHLGTVA